MDIIMSNTFLLWHLVFRRGKSTVESTSFSMLLMWHFQDRSGVMVTPRYFNRSVDLSVVW